MIKTIDVCAKCIDLCTTTLLDEAGDRVFFKDGYVPAFLPGQWGDYLILRINVETGMIENWTKPTQEQLQEWVQENSK